jgi:hypothetical protein
MKSVDTAVVYLYRAVLFPFCNLTLSLRMKRYGSLEAGNRVIAFPVRNIIDVLFPGGRVATLAEVVEVKQSEGAVHLQLKGLSRVRIGRVRRFFTAGFEVEEGDDKKGRKKLREELRKKSQELIFLINAEESDKLIHLLNFIVNLGQLTYFVTNYFVLRFGMRFLIYRESDPEKRAASLLAVLDELIEGFKEKKDRE